MRTIKNLIEEKKSSINESFKEGVSADDAKVISVSIALDSYYERKCKKILVRGVKGTFTIFNIESESFIQKLRDFYVICKNPFVKKVMATVGIERKMTQKQMEVITDEMVKYPEFIYEF